MKRTLPLILTLCMLLSLLPFAVYGDGAAELAKYDLSGIDEECRTGQMVVYTQGGQSTGTSEKCTEALVDKDGKIISVGGYNNTVPAGGFVLAGSGSKAKIVEGLKVGDGMFYNTSAMKVTVVPGDYNPFYQTSVTVNGVNTVRKQDTIILFDGKDGKTTTGTNAWGFEVTVDKNGYVTVADGNDSQIPEGGFVLSGHGTGKTALSEAARLGMKVTLSSDRKKATFAFDKDSALKEYEQQKLDLADGLQKALQEGRLVDKAAVEEALSVLETMLGNMEGYLAKNNYTGYLKTASEFENACKNVRRSMTEDTPVEGRGVWLRPTLTKDRDKIFETVRSIWEAGFNQVYLEVQFDNTVIIPVPEGSLYSQNPALVGSDILEIYIEACHSYGIELHAWMSVFRTGYEGSANTKLSVGMKKPEWRQISKNGVNYVANTYGNAFFLNPALPEVREFLLETYRYILENYDLDGFQLDYIRYPNKADGEEFGYDEYTLKLYKDQYGKDPKTFANGSADYTQWVQFRADFVTEFVRSVKELIDEIRPDVYLGAAVAPGYANSLVNMNQDSVRWMEEELIDIVFPMAYGSTDAVIRYLDETTAAAGKNVCVYAGVSDQGYEILEDQILATRENGADGIAFFSWNVYDSRYDPIGEWLFEDKALSPTYDGKAAMLAQLGQLAKRLTGEKLSEKVSTVAEALQAGSLTSCKTELKNLLDELSAADGVSEAMAGDLAVAYRILENNKDDEKAEYRKEHPLPDSLIPDDEEPEDPGEGGEESVEESAEASAEESAEESKDEVVLTPVENTFRIISLVILFGGLALLPLYFLLYSRRKKIIRSFEEPKEEEEEQPSEENSSEE